MLTGRDNVPVDCTTHRLMTHLFTQVKLLKKLQKLAGEVLVALGAPQGHSWAPRAKFFALEPSNWTPESNKFMYISQVSGERLQDHWSSGFVQVQQKLFLGAKEIGWSILIGTTWKKRF